MAAEKAVLRVGTSGFAYKEWKGTFYPEKMAEAKMLEFYSRHFPTVEINYTFYRLPSAKTLEGWVPQTPEGFCFALKANQKITHILRLRGAEALLRAFYEGAQPLQNSGRLGPVLFQLPPNFRADLKLLDDFLAALPRALRSAMEFRHSSWFTDAMLECLRARNVALCIAETEDGCAPLEATAGFAYFRLRKENYEPRDLAAWRDRFTGWLAKGRDLYVYFKHEDSGRAPAYASKLLAGW
jgi:uncharacterized protein YecE (DUF72 family)